MIGSILISVAGQLAGTAAKALAEKHGCPRAVAGVIGMFVTAATGNICRAAAPDVTTHGHPSSELLHPDGAFAILREYQHR